MVDTPDSPYEQPLDLPGGDSQPGPSHSFRPPKRKRSFKKLLFIPLVLLLLVGLGLGLKQLSKPKPAAPAQTNEPTAKPAPTKTEAAATGTKSFTAETLAVQFNYPDNWKVTEKDAGITVTSPEFSYQTKAGVDQTGTFRVYIRNGARDTDSKYIGRAVVVQPTEKMAYSRPNPNQRKQTELSFFGYDDSSNFAFMMITPSFNLQKGQTLGPNYGKEASAYIIVAGYSLTTYKDDLSFQTVSPTDFRTAAAFTQALNIFKSLKVS